LLKYIIPLCEPTAGTIEIFDNCLLKKDCDKTNIDINAEEFKQWIVAKWSITPERDM